MSTSLENLPDITFAEKAPEIILTELIADFEKEADRKLYPGDPLRIILLGFTKYVTLLKNDIDYAGKQNLLKYAGEGFLENLAALLGVEKLKPASAITTIRFTLSSIQQSAVTIPKGTRVTAGDKVYFATVQDAEIPKGDLSVEVTAECTETGEVGNGYYPGQITSLVDYFPYFDSLENITISSGGANQEGLDSMRERTRIAPESFSSAGPYGAYEFWAKTASQLIVDVSVETPEPGVVEIIPLLAGGEIPTEDILEEVYNECSPSSRRPLTDKVVVRVPKVVNYDLQITYYISRSKSSVGLSIQSAIEKAVQDYVLWQKTVLGRDINPSKLTSMIVEAGAKRIEVNSPTFKKINYDQLAVANTPVVIYGGLEDD